MTDPLIDGLHRLADRVLDPGVVDPVAIARHARSRRRRRRGGLGVALLIVVAAVAVPLRTVGGHHGRTQVQVVDTPPVIAGVLTSELTVDGQPALACGGLAPLSALTAAGGAERADTPEAAGLRNLIAHDVTGGESPQHGGDWVLLRESGGHVHFGQRTGAVGIGATVDLMRNGSSYVFSGSGGCGPVGYADHMSPQVVETYTVRGDELSLAYEGGTCDTEPVSAHVYEHRDAVDVLVVQPPAPPMKDACGGAGTDASVSVRLTTPLGARTVRDIAYLPVRVVPSAAAAQTQSEQENREIDGAEVLCARAAGRTVREGGDSNYPVDVAVVRKDVPAAATAWRTIPASQLAALCYEDNGDHSETQLVATTGQSPIVLDRHYTANPLARLPDDHSQVP